MPQSDRQTRRTYACVFLFLLAGCVAGCEDVDWNWDFTGWKQPKRVVRPTRRHPPPADQSTDPAPSSTSGDRPQRQARQTAPAAGPGPAVTAPERLVDDKSPGSAEPAKPTLPQRPFYQLYLLSGSGSDVADHRGDSALQLENAGTRACSHLLDMLYPPLGRSGRSDECYLLYENRAEFEAAVKLAPWLDTPPLDSAPPTIGADASFRTGVGLLLKILEQGALVDHGQVDECELHLAAATQSRQLPPLRRWAAGILAGRLVAEYRYDYSTARSYYRQAERAAAPNSLEQMTARWWHADALAQEDKTRDATNAYRAILKTYGAKWKNSHIVRRARAILDKRRN